MPATYSEPSNAAMHLTSLAPARSYPITLVDRTMFQSVVDRTFCQMSAVNSFRVYVSNMACGVPLPAGYNLPAIAPATGVNTATWEIPVIATWKRGEIPFMTSGSVQVTAGNSGAGFWSLRADNLTFNSVLNTPGRVRGDSVLNLYGDVFAKSADTLGCTYSSCSTPTVTMGTSFMAATNYNVSALKPTLSRPCYPGACPVLSEGLQGNGPELTRADPSVDGLNGYFPLPGDPPRVINVTASSARIETWYGPWNSMYMNRPVAANAQTIYSTTKRPPNPMIETVNGSGQLTATYQLSDDTTLTQFIRICTGTTGTYSGCQTYYSWEERNQPAMVKVQGSATVSSLMETAPRVSGGPLLSRYPTLGLNRKMTIQSSGELRINANMTYPLPVCFGQTKITLSGATANVTPAYCQEDPVAGVSTQQSTLLGLRSTGGNIVLTSNAQRQPITINASLMADQGEISALQTSRYKAEILGNVYAKRISVSSNTLSRVEPDSRLSSGRLSAPGFPVYQRQVLHSQTNFAPAVRTDQLRNTTLGGLNGNP